MTTLTKLALGATTAAAALGLASAASAATLFDANMEVTQSTATPPGPYEGQIGQAGLVLNETDTGYALAMSITFSDGLDFSGVESQFDNVVGSSTAAEAAQDVNGLHIHNAERGATGPIVFSIFNFIPSEPVGDSSDNDGDNTLTYNEDGTVSVSSEWDLTEGAPLPPELGGEFVTLEAFVGELLAASENEDVALYLNLHTLQNPTGLIRGQLVGQNDAVPIPGALALFGTAMAGGAFVRRKRAA